jgi:hypothetical protein
MSAKKFFDIAVTLEVIAMSGAIGYAAWKHIQLDPESRVAEFNEKMREFNNSIKVAVGFAGITALTLGAESAHYLLKGK